MSTRSEQILLSSSVHSISSNICWCNSWLYRSRKRTIPVSHVQVTLCANSRGLLRERSQDHCKQRHERHGDRRQLSLLLRVPDRQRHSNHSFLPWTQRWRNVTSHLLLELPCYVWRRPWVEPGSIWTLQIAGVRLAESVAIRRDWVWRREFDNCSNTK